MYTVTIEKDTDINGKRISHKETFNYESLFLAIQKFESINVRGLYGPQKAVLVNETGDQICKKEGFKYKKWVSE